MERSCTGCFPWRVLRKTHGQTNASNVMYQKKMVKNKSKYCNRSDFKKWGVTLGRWSEANNTEQSSLPYTLGHVPTRGLMLEVTIACSNFEISIVHTDDRLIFIHLSPGPQEPSRCWCCGSHGADGHRLVGKLKVWKILQLDMMRLSIDGLHQVMF